VLGVGKTGCYNAIVRHGITRKRAPACCVDDTFFDNIDNEEKAYWLGFLTADGNIPKTGKGVRLQLAVRDTGHVMKFAQATQSTHKMTTCWTKEHPSTHIVISSRKLAAALVRLGVVPNKSFIVKPASIHPELTRHYWRGLVDGDGSVGFFNSARHSGGKLPFVKLSGTKAIVTGFADFVTELTGKAQKTASDKSIWVVVFRGRTAVLIAYKLYDHATVALDRKQAAANMLFDWYEETK
jgi:hypothetical protein